MKDVVNVLYIIDELINNHDLWRMDNKFTIDTLCKLEQTSIFNVLSAIFVSVLSVLQFIKLRWLLFTLPDTRMILVDIEQRAEVNEENSLFFNSCQTRYFTWLLLLKNCYYRLLSRLAMQRKN